MRLRVLKQSDLKAVLDFCYKREKENLFVLSSFEKYEIPFEYNAYVGVFEGDHIVALGTYFTLYKNVVVNADSPKYIEPLVDFFIKNFSDFKGLLAFRKCAEPAYLKIQEKHNKRPKVVKEEIVYELAKEDFQNFDNGSALLATHKDLDALVSLDQIESSKKSQPVTNTQREQAKVNSHFVVKVDCRIVSKAAVQGNSKHYFQIGGVLTSKAERGNSYAKQVVSGLCQHYFEAGYTHGLLLVEEANVSAQKLYKTIGFKPTGEFLIVEY